MWESTFYRELSYGRIRTYSDRLEALCTLCGSRIHQLCLSCEMWGGDSTSLKKNEGGDLHTFPDLSWPRDHRSRHGYSPTHPDNALCSRRVRASSIQRWCERAPSRGGLKGAMLSDQPAAWRRHPGKAPAAIGVVSPRTVCPKTLSGPSIRAHRRVGGASGCGARSPTASGSSFGG